MMPRSTQLNVDKIVAAGILVEATGRKRNRIYRASKVVSIAREIAVDGRGAMFSSAQQSHFEAFGFLVFRKQFSPAAMEMLAAVFDRNMATYQSGPRHVEEWECVVDYALANPDLCEQFLGDDLIQGALAALLGPDFVWYGASCNWFGTGKWHPDQHGYERGSIKILIYLDPLRADSGSLRLIPGSHRPPLHEILEPHQPPNEDSEDGMFGMRGVDLPAFDFESDPGDAILFSKALWHGAFDMRRSRDGEASLRRMVSFSFGPNRQTPELLEYFRSFFQREEEVVPPNPPPAERLKQLGRKRTAAMIARLTSMGLHTRACGRSPYLPQNSKGTAR